MNDFATRPPKMTLVNLANGRELEAQFNPEQLEETFGAVWSSTVVPGLSHTVRQFTHTKDTVVKFTLLWSSANGGKPQQQIIMEARKFFKAGTYPRAVAGNIKSAGAPRFLFVWPQLMSLTCTIDEVKLSHRRFNVKGMSVSYSAELSLTEISDDLMTMEDVLRTGGNAKLPPKK